MTQEERQKLDAALGELESLLPQLAEAIRDLRGRSLLPRLAREARDLRGAAMRDDAGIGDRAAVAVIGPDGRVKQTSDSSAKGETNDAISEI
jgi:hypothetical protein